MSVAKTEIRNRALRKLGVIGFGETPESEISSDMDAAYSEVYARLEKAEIVSWAVDANVPNTVVPQMVALCAYARMSEHGISQQRRDLIIAEAGLDGSKAINEIRGRVSTAYQSTDEVEYY